VVAARRLLINSIGPARDGNEVCSVTGGALFASFPHVCAATFSEFDPVIILQVTATIGTLTYLPRMAGISYNTPICLFCRC